MRFEKTSICRYDQDDVIRRVFAITGLPPPPPEKARKCVEEILRAGSMIEKFLLSPDGVRKRCGRLAVLLEMLDAPMITPTMGQVKDPKQAGNSLHVLSVQARNSVELHAGIGALFYRAEGDTLISQVAPLTGTGMDMRRDYLLSVIEMTRDTIEQTFS